MEVNKETKYCLLIHSPKVKILTPFIWFCFNFPDPDLVYWSHQIAVLLDRIKYYLKQKHQQVATYRGAKPLTTLEESQIETIYINGSSPNFSIKIH